MQAYGEGPQHTNTEEAFFEIADQLRASEDIGLTSFDREMVRVQEKLKKKYAKSKKKRFNHKESANYETDLTEAWDHEGDIATISGRVYFFGRKDKYGDRLAEWGEATADENGEVYFIVEGIKLRSLGVEIIPIYTKKGRVSDVKAMYTFTSPEDKSLEPAFGVYVGEAYEHTYERPTAIEAKERLEKEWPRQFALIEEWIKANGKVPIHARLQFIANELQDELAASKKFRQYVERHLQASIKFDTELPYNFMVVRRMELLENDKVDPYTDLQECNWQEYQLEGSLSRQGFYPKIELTLQKDGTVECTILLAAFNAEDGPKPEYIRLNVDYITAFRGTRAVKSLVARATSGKDGYVIPNEPQENDTFTGETLLSIRRVSAAEFEDAPSNEVPPVVQELIDIEAAVKAAQKLVKAHAKIKYETYEQAKNASRALIEQRIMSLFPVQQFNHSVECLVTNAGVVVPNGKSEFSESEQDSASQLFIYALNKERPMLPLEDGDYQKGKLLNIGSFVEEVRDPKGNIKWHRIKPSLIMAISTERYVPLAVNEIPLVDIDITTKVFAPLDGTADIKIARLEDYRTVRSIIDELYYDYPESLSIPLMEQLQRQLLAANNEHEYIDFEEAYLFPHLAEPSSEGEASSKLFSKTIEVFERILIGAQVQLQGDIFVRDTGGIRKVSGKLESDAVLNGKVIDVCTDGEGGDIFIALKSPGGVIAYVPPRTITKLMF